MLVAPDKQHPLAAASQELYGSGTEARQSAFDRRDAEESRRVHQQMLGQVPLSFKSHLQREALASSELLRALVFGGLDGISTIFATVAGCLGAKLTPFQTLIVGLGNLLANAISMGFGEYLSASAEADLIDAEREREEWELRNCPDEEKREMVEIYEHRYGFSHADAEQVIEISFKYPEFFVSHMMAEELGLLVQSEDAGEGASPFFKGVVMFLSFAVFGLLPLSAYLAIHSALFARFNPSRIASFGITGIVSCAALFALGVTKSKFVAREKPFKAGLTMLLNGGFAGLVAYSIGLLLQYIAGAAVLD